MTTTLDGKWVWIWNWRRCQGGDAAAVARRLTAAGCRGALVKAYDGARWFDQGSSWRDIARTLRSHGLAVGGWGYHYGAEIAGEAERAIETVGYGGADLLVLDVESEFEGRAGAAEQLCQRIREALDDGYPLYFSSFAIARYHSGFPYDVFRLYCSGAAPQVYWNAFRWPQEQALDWTLEDHRALGWPAERLFPVAGLYQEANVPYPHAHDVNRFVQRARASGSGGVSFWSYEHMSEAMWDAVAGTDFDKETEMSSQEFQQVSRSLSALTKRVDRIEAEVAALGRPATPKPRSYTVKPGDTLSSIASAFGLADWKRLYEANRAVIGGDPNLIRPGQVISIP